MIYFNLYFLFPYIISNLAVYLNSINRGIMSTLHLLLVVAVVEGSFGPQLVVVAIEPVRYV
jgi:hypothetical protein